MVKPPRETRADFRCWPLSVALVLQVPGTTALRELSKIFIEEGGHGSFQGYPAAQRVT